MRPTAAITICKYYNKPQSCLKTLCPAGHTC